MVDMIEQSNDKNGPRHIAIIMDGNGRWAKGRNLSRTEGHMEGVKRVEEIIEAADVMGIKVLTLYAFSTENWSRPKIEVAMLMKALEAVLNKKIQKLKKNNIKLHVIGRTERIPKFVLKTLNMVIEETKNNTGLIVNLAFNYGARQEIIDAVQNISRAVQEGQLNADDICEETINHALYTKGLPDPDLLIRTSGEKRISNFLLWQLSYAEFYFTDKFWPDFDKEELKKAIIDYRSRERRYGKVPMAN